MKKLKLFFFSHVYCRIFGHRSCKCVDLEGNLFNACFRCRTYLSPIEPEYDPYGDD